MHTIPDLIFLTGLACLFVHELDAIQQKEWRFFFAPFNLSDEHAYPLFIALHVPLFVLIVANVHTQSFQIGLDTFLIVHAMLHWLLRNHPHINFNNAFSRLWIFGGGALGAVHLIVLAL